MISLCNDCSDGDLCTDGNLLECKIRYCNMNNHNGFPIDGWITYKDANCPGCNHRGCPEWIFRND